MAPVVFILTAKITLFNRRPCELFWCSIQTIVELSHFSVCNIWMKHTQGLKFHYGNQKNISFLLITKSKLSLGKLGINFLIWSSTFTPLEVKVKEIFLQSVYFLMTFIYKFVLYYNYSIPISHCEDVQNCLEL